MLARLSYRFIYRFIKPLLPYSAFSQYLKWKLALMLIGTEFHQDNLQNNREKLARHFDANAPLQPELAALLPAKSMHCLKVLDIGAGPMSKVGKRHNGSNIELVAIDPIADKYQALLKQLALTPPVATLPGFGERLREQFSDNSFDLIHARNCIDHCRDPLLVIQQAISVLKPQCYFYLNHYRNEGIAANYYGLHQWNFDAINGNFVITGAFGNTTNVNQAIASQAKVTSIETSAERLVVVIQKR
ncbi:class I SAM-dependent methyltransferase [Rheinheimera sp. UJ63]|uniref:class I SAM-dependent methyltransferase n=1 Tax=Rheinheimera sp. UJ63 TaxID=2910157 RepID=UPI001F3AB0E9|nr:class I SAM-dependent methyltransferase [Rheinheimera sp. UJ63]MCF4009995.1 class I SAM-dependent methyltransferase [Rheinheimera sp. UJ63]